MQQCCNTCITVYHFLLIFFLCNYIKIIFYQVNVISESKTATRIMWKLCRYFQIMLIQNNSVLSDFSGFLVWICQIIQDCLSSEIHVLRFSELIQTTSWKDIWRGILTTCTNDRRQTMKSWLVISDHLLGLRERRCCHWDHDISASLCQLPVPSCSPQVHITFASQVPVLGKRMKAGFRTRALSTAWHISKE